jgi:hypothetical protein
MVPYQDFEDVQLLLGRDTGPQLPADCVPHFLDDCMCYMRAPSEVWRAAASRVSRFANGCSR